MQAEGNLPMRPRFSVWCALLHRDSEIEVEACKCQYEQQYTAADEPEEDFQDFFKHFPDSLRLSVRPPTTPSHTPPHTSVHHGN